MTQEVATPASVSQHQLIDTERIKAFFTDASSQSSETYAAVKADVLELVEHVENLGFLEQIATARKEMAEEVFPSLH